MKHPRRKLDPAVAFWVARCLVAISCVSFVLCSIAAWKTRFWTSVCWCPENECHSPVLFSLNFYSVPPRCCNLVFEVHSSRMVFPFVNGNGVYPRFKKKYILMLICGCNLTFTTRNSLIDDRIISSQITEKPLRNGICDVFSYHHVLSVTY